MFIQKCDSCNTRIIGVLVDELDVYDDVVMGIVAMV
jgi:hypothetical protein